MKELTYEHPEKYCRRPSNFIKLILDFWCNIFLKWFKDKKYAYIWGNALELGLDPTYYFHRDCLLKALFLTFKGQKNPGLPGLEHHAACDLFLFVEIIVKHQPSKKEDCKRCVFRKSLPPHFLELRPLVSAWTVLMALKSIGNGFSVLVFSCCDLMLNMELDLIKKDFVNNAVELTIFHIFASGSFELIFHKMQLIYVRHFNCMLHNT